MIGVVTRYTDYKSKAAAIAAYNADADFTIMDISSKWNTMAANKSDLQDEGRVKIRYNKMTRVVIVDAKTGKEIT